MIQQETKAIASWQPSAVYTKFDSSPSKSTQLF